MDLLIAPGTVDAAHADKAPATGTPGWATDGNPATGMPATLWPAYAFNALQEELSTVIKQAGISLSRGDNTQLHAAIKALINKQQSPNDATAGRALTVGNAFGIGAVNHLNQVDLDTVRTSGLYSQWNSSWATIASHYPVSGINGTGSLVVVSSGNGDIITQQYTTFADAQTYTRACALGTWGSWKRTVTSDETATEARRGIAQVATAAQAQAMSSDGVILSPLKLGSAFAGVNTGGGGSINYQIFPGTAPNRLMVQWGVATTNGASVAPAAFPLAFATAPIVCGATHSGSGALFVTLTTLPTTTGAQFTAHLPNGAGGGANLNINFMAIGRV